MTSRRQRRRIKLIAWGALVLLCACLLLVPYQSGMLRRFLVGGVFLAWGGGLFLFWQAIVARVIFLLPLAAAVGLALLPYRNSDSARMQAGYIAALRSYEGTPYLWGGESHRGIDCSGLIRAAMIDTCLAEGWRTKDLSLLRSAAALWWYDASAEEIGKGYSGRTYVYKEETTLNTADDTKLRVGDLAVTQSGQHILAYLGENTWINADPKGKFMVISKKAPDEKEAWFSTPVKLVRWYRLQ
jgi:hypothetical protein